MRRRLNSLLVPFSWFSHTQVKRATRNKYNRGLTVESIGFRTVYGASRIPYNNNNTQEKRTIRQIKLGRRAILRQKKREARLSVG